MIGSVRCVAVRSGDSRPSGLILRSSRLGGLSAAQPLVDARLPVAMLPRIVRRLTRRVESPPIVPPIDYVARTV